MCIEEEGFHPHIEVKINNKAGVLLVDTGASKTVFDSGSIHHYIKNLETLQNDKLTTGLGTNSMISHKAIINRIAIGKLELFKFEAVLIDLSHVNNSYEQLNLPNINGVLGSDLLMKFRGVVDYNKKQLIFNFKI
jgi:predicted aspartyl protease